MKLPIINTCISIIETWTYFLSAYAQTFLLPSNHARSTTSSWPTVMVHAPSIVLWSEGTDALLLINGKCSNFKPLAIHSLAYSSDARRELDGIHNKER